MIKKISSSIFILLSLNSWAQENTSYLSYHGEAGIVNNSIHAAQIWEGMQLGFWDAEFKNGLLNSIDEKNTAYFQAYDRLEYGQNKWSLSYQYKIEGFASVSKDLLELGLFGNAPTAGRTLSFSNTYLDYHRYSELSFSHQIGHHLKGSIALLMGHELNKFHFNNSSLFTAENGEHLDYSLHFTHYASDSTARGLFNPNGLGSSLGLCYQDTIENSRFSIQVSNIGFIKWNAQTQTTSLDESLHFEGIEIEDILSFNDSLINLQTDTLLETQHTQESYTSKLPIRLAFYGETTTAGWLDHIGYGAAHRPGYYETPLLYAHLTKSFNKHSLSLGLRGGGMEHLGVSAAYRYQSNKTEFSLYTQQANVVHKPSAYGLHIGFGIKKVFLPKAN